MAAKHNQRRPERRAKERNPAHAIHALVREERCGEGKDDGQGADHQGGVAYCRVRQPLELEKELEWDAKHRGDEQDDSVTARPASPLVRAHIVAGKEAHGQGTDTGKQKAVEHHMTDAHLAQGELPKVEAGTPETAGDGAGCVSQPA